MKPEPLNLASKRTTLSSPLTYLPHSSPQTNSTLQERSALTDYNKPRPLNIYTHRPPSLGPSPTFNPQHLLHHTLNSHLHPTIVPQSRNIDHTEMMLLLSKYLITTHTLGVCFFLNNASIIMLLLWVCYFLIFS